MLISSICFLNLFLHRYDKVISKCINTLTYMGYFIYFSMLSMMYRTCSGFLSRVAWHHLECMTLASMAVAKSRQNICILVVKDVLTSFSTQDIRSCSMQVWMIFYFIEHFCKMAKQNLCVTFPFYCSYRIAITRLMMESLLL